LKILHVIPSLSPSQGGPSFALPLMERALADAGMEITTVTTDDDGPGRRLNTPLGQPIRVERATRLYFRKQTEFYKCSLPLWWWLRSNVYRFDLVHVHSLFSFASTLAMSCARGHKVDYVVRPLGVLNRYGMERRRPGLKRLSFRSIESPLLRHAARLHYTSHREKQEAEQTGVRALSAVIPIGIDVARFARLPGPSRFFERFPASRGRTIILFLSRIDPKKGLELLLPAFAQAVRKRPDALLVIAGASDNGYLARLHELARSLHLENSVLWTGRLDDADKLSALAASTAFVLPSLSENFGVALVEALAAGLPCIATSGVAVADDIRERDAGLVSAAEVSSISLALERLLADHALRARVGANARQLAVDRFSLEAMGTALSQLYRELDPRPVQCVTRRTESSVLSR
jgi:glycosyltransferase involved in cell wall biosynthesis